MLRLDTAQDLWPLSFPCHPNMTNMLCILVQVARALPWWVAFAPKSPATQWGMASARERMGGRMLHCLPSPETPGISLAKRQEWQYPGRHPPEQDCLLPWGTKA